MEFLSTLCGQIYTQNSDIQIKQQTVNIVHYIVNWSDFEHSPSIQAVIMTLLHPAAAVPS